MLLFIGKVCVERYKRMFEHGIDFLFNETSLYTKEIFNVFELKDSKYECNKEELYRFLFYIGISQDKLITHCHKCKKEFPFSVKIEGFDFERSKGITNCLVLTNTNSQTGIGGIDLHTGNILGLQPPYEHAYLLNNKICYIEYFFTCTNRDKHKYIMMISIELKDGNFIVRKIGQNPSMLTVKGFDFDKYKKFLEKINAYSDYKKADLSNAEHFFVGAFAYLRRIFEKIIHYYLGDTKLKDNRMDTRIEAVKDHFDPRVQKLLNNLYGILSISIHELDEDESKEYYSYLKAVIDMQLEYIKSEADKEGQSKELGNILSKITGLIDKKK